MAAWLNTVRVTLLSMAVATGLGVADQPTRAAARHQAQLRQLRALPAAGFAGDDQHLVGPDGLHDLVGPLGDGQRVGAGQHPGGAQGVDRDVAVVHTV